MKISKFLGVVAVLVVFLFVMPAIFALSGAYGAEADYQKEWCDKHGGQMEVTMADRTRADCITFDHAVEFDWGYKWAESGFQALNYAMYTGKRAKIVLILQKETDKKYYQRVVRIIRHYGLPIDIETMIGYQ